MSPPAPNKSPPKSTTSIPNPANSHLHHQKSSAKLHTTTAEQSFQLISTVFRILEELSNESTHMKRGEEFHQLDKLHQTLGMLRNFFLVGSEESAYDKHAVFVYFVNQCFIKHKERIVDHCDLWANVLQMLSEVIVENHWMEMDWEAHAVVRRGTINKQNHTTRGDESPASEGGSETPSATTPFVSPTDHIEKADFLRRLVSTSQESPSAPQIYNFRYTDASSLLEYQSVLWIRLKDTISPKLRESANILPYAARNFFHTVNKSIESLLQSLLDIVASLCGELSSSSSVTNREICLKHSLILIFTLQHMFDMSNFLYSYFVELSLLECFDLFLMWLKYHVNFEEEDSEDSISVVKIEIAQLMGRIMLRLIENHELALHRFIDNDGVKVLRRKLLKCPSEPLLRVLSSLFRYTKRYQQQGNDSHSRRTMQVVGITYRLSNLALRFSPDSWLQGDYVNLSDEHSCQLACQRQWKKLVEYLQMEEDLFEKRNEMFLPLSDEMWDGDNSSAENDSNHHSDSDDEFFPQWEMQRLKASIVLKPSRAFYAPLSS